MFELFTFEMEGKLWLLKGTIETTTFVWIYDPSQMS